MKSNAPEKIYLYPSDRAGEEYENEWGDKPWGKDYVEYTRTDAFIEKTFEFFGEHLWEYIDVKYTNCDTFINVDSDKLKEDFINYMKGE